MIVGCGGEGPSTVVAWLVILVVLPTQPKHIVEFDVLLLLHVLGVPLTHSAGASGGTAAGVAALARLSGRLGGLYTGFSPFLRRIVLLPPNMLSMVASFWCPLACLVHVWLVWSLLFLYP